MAKKKDKVEEVEISLNDYREQLRKGIIKKYGEGISREMTDMANQKKIIVPVSPAVDIGLHGGVPEGSWVTLAGPPKFGKTTLALQLASNAQKPEYGGKMVYYLDVEGRFKHMNLTSVAAFNPDMCEHIRSQKGKILSAEDYLDIAMDIIKGHPGCVIILDSGSALCAAKELGSEGITASYRNEGPKLLAAFCRQMANVVPINDTILVMIQHIIANTGYGGGQMEDGGNKIKYQVDVKLRGKYTEKWDDTDGSAIGQLAHWEVMSSALGAPNAKIKNYVRYGYGIDETMELIEIAADLGIINKAGSWYSFDFNGEEIKAQGMEKLHHVLKEDNNKYLHIKQQVAAI